MRYNAAVARLKMPKRIAALPVDERGYPVPKFVLWTDGKPDFRIMDAKFLRRAWQHKLCWTCGEPLGKHMAFVIGPMCSVNRTSSEPPSHYDCAHFAVRACPFMAHPERRRDERDLPENRSMAGIPIERNPGVAVIWVTNSYTAHNVPNGVLFRIGAPEKTEWFTRGRAATREEIMHAFDTGLPALREVAEFEGPSAVAELQSLTERALALVPAAEISK
jgi:hypothetical protein